MKLDRKHLTGFLSGIILMLAVSIGYVNARDIFTLPKTNGRISKVEAQNEQKNEDIIPKLDEINGILDKYYLEEIDSSKLIEGMYKGMVSGLGDPYSVYYTEDEYKDLMISTSGTFSGIGVLVSQDAKTYIITVVKPFANGPGYKVGLQPGDIIIKVDGEDVTGQELSKVVTKIKGKEGTKVTVTVYREGEDKPLDFEITRAKIDVPTIEYEMLKNQVGYIQITEFDEVTYNQFKTALTDLDRRGQKGLIIDLRDNPGGLLHIVAKIADELLPEGLIVYTENKYGVIDKINSDGKTKFTKPLVVLVNGNSASASEILSGAIKDYGIGTVVGTTTFGKGVVQRIIQLKDGTAIKVTISKYFTPKGNDINGKGVEPDVVIELPDEIKKKPVKTKEEDVQLQKAIEIINGKIK